jgi:hypothetical protein
MTAANGDEGFVMLDALVAVAILALVGTGALALASDLLSRLDRQLDRSSALLMSDLVAQQYAELGPNPAATRVEDELFVYEVVATGEPASESRLQPMAVIVRNSRSRSAQVLQLDFLATEARFP